MKRISCSRSQGGMNIDIHTPIRLAEAVKLAFPDGTMGVTGLRKERDKGRLTTEMIAGKEYVTLAEIQRMRELCRVQRKAPGSSGVRNTGARTVRSYPGQDGISKMVPNEPESAKTLALQIANRLRNG